VLVLVIVGFTCWVWRAAELPPAVATVEPTIEQVAAQPAPVARVSLADPRSCEIRGTFVLPGGAPASGVQLWLLGAEGNPELVRQYGLPKDWEHVEGATAEDGSFRLRFVPPRAFQFFLEGHLAGYCSPRWRWSRIEYNQVVDVGTIALVRGGSVRARVVNAEGRRLKGWIVYAKEAREPEFDGRDLTRVIDGRCDSNGEYLLENLPPGPVAVSAETALTDSITCPTVEVRAGEVTEVELRYLGPDTKSRIVVEIITPLFHGLSVQIDEVLLRAPGVEPRTSGRLARGASATFDGVAPGRYTVEVRDRKFQPWSSDKVWPAQRIRAKLKGNAAASLQVLDEKGAALKGYALGVRFDNLQSMPNVFWVLEPGRELPTPGLLDGLVPGDLTLIIECPGYLRLEVPLPNLRPEETRPLVARLARS